MVKEITDNGRVVDHGFGDCVDEGKKTECGLQCMRIHILRCGDFYSQRKGCSGGEAR